MQGQNKQQNDGNTDFWGATMVADTDAPTANAFAQAPAAEQKTNPLLVVLLIVLFAGIAYLSYDMFAEGDDFAADDYGAEDYGTGGFAEEPSLLDQILAFITGEDLPGDFAQPQAAPKADGNQKAEAADSSEEMTGEVVEGNPYWALPNQILGLRIPLNRTWSPEEEDVWRAGIAHTFNYQRFKTVMEVREQRLAGSDVILWEALNEIKLWTRMWAAVALAEFNFELTLGDVERAMGTAGSELLADYFERFVKSSTSGSRYVMRHAIKLLDAKGRLVILRALDQADDPSRDLYMVAASYDPSEKIRRWLGSALDRRPISQERWDQLAKVVETGNSQGAYGEGDSMISELAVEPLAVSEDLETEMEQLESSQAAEEEQESIEYIEDDEGIYDATGE